MTIFCGMTSMVRKASIAWLVCYSSANYPKRTASRRTIVQPRHLGADLNQISEKAMINETEKYEKKGSNIPKQQQPRQPGLQTEMHPQPDSGMAEYHGSGKLDSKVAIITGGDSGIGRSVAIAFAKEGADIAVAYLDEHEDAQRTKEEVEKCGRKCILIAGDVGGEKFCAEVVEKRFPHSIMSKYL